MRRLLFVLLFLLPLSGATPPPDLAARIAPLLRMEGGEPVIWSIYVADARTGEAVYARDAGLAMLPASTMKLLTSATALDALGSGYRYETRLLFRGTRSGGLLKGDLVIEGAGDPSFGSSEVGGADPLAAWARALAGQGVRRVEGRIIGDDNRFDDRPYAEGWDVDYIATQSSRLLGISAGGLAYHDNLVEIRLQPGRVGAAPTLTASPAGYLDVVNRATTSARRRGRAARLDRTLGVEQATVSGTIARSYAATFSVPVLNPTALALHAFRSALQAEGIEVAATLHDVDEMEKPPRVEGAEVLMVHQSPPLADLLKIVNKESNNFYAEQIFRTFAWGGGAAGGEARVKALVQRAGAPSEFLSIRDGSGLSRKDLVTAEAMGRVLVLMNAHPERQAFRASMAQGGEAQSTLHYRMKELPVQAKTGSLEYVRALAGYVQTADGRELAFTIFANNFAAPPYRITQAIDAIVTELSAAGPA